MTPSSEADRQALEALAACYAVTPDDLRALVPGFAALTGATHRDPHRLLRCANTLTTAAAAGLGGLAPYAHDAITKRLPHTLSPVFGPGTWLPCPTATAAGVIALRHFATSLRPGMIFFEDIGHAAVLEAGSTAASSGGVLSAVPIATDSRGMLSIEALRMALHVHCPAPGDANLGREHFPAPRAVIVSWPSPRGTITGLDELDALRVLCRSRQMALIIDCVWGVHAVTAMPQRQAMLHSLADLADAMTFSLTKMHCGIGAMLFVPRGSAALADELRALAKPIGSLVSESWDVSARWEAAWLSHQSLVAAAAQADNARASGIREGLRQRGAAVQPDSVANVVLFAVPRELSDVLASQGVTRWPLHAHRQDWQMMRIVTGPWYPTGWETAIFAAVDRATQ